MSGKDISSIADLISDPENARKHTPRNLETIARALQEVGAARSIVVDEEGRILAGNATVEAAGEVGINNVIVVDADGETLIAVRRSGLTAEQKRRLALLDNRSAEFAVWDIDRIIAMQEEGFDFEGIFYPEELESILAIQPHLDDILEEYGEPEESDFWPFIRVQVDPDTFARFEELVQRSGQDSPSAAMAAILGAVDETILSGR